MPRGYYFWRRACIEGAGCKIVDNGDSNGVTEADFQADNQRRPRRCHRNQGGPASRTGLYEWRARPECAGRVATWPEAATAHAEHRYSSLRLQASLKGAAEQQTHRDQRCHGKCEVEHRGLPSDAHVCEGCAFKTRLASPVEFV